MIKSKTTRRSKGYDILKECLGVIAFTKQEQELFMDMLCYKASDKFLSIPDVIAAYNWIHPNNRMEEYLTSNHIKDINLGWTTAAECGKFIDVYGDMDDDMLGFEVNDNLYLIL